MEVHRAEVHTAAEARKWKVEIDTPFLTLCFLAFVGLRQNHSFVLNITMFINQFLRHCLRIFVIIFLIWCCYQWSTGWNCTVLIWGQGLLQRHCLSHLQLSTSSLLLLYHSFLTSEIIWKDSRNSDMLCASFPQTQSSMWLCSQSARRGEVFFQMGSDLAVLFSQSGNKIKPVN